MWIADYHECQSHECVFAYVSVQSLLCPEVFYRMQNRGWYLAELGTGSDLSGDCIKMVGAWVSYTHGILISRCVLYHFIICVTIFFRYWCFGTLCSKLWFFYSFMNVTLRALTIKTNRDDCRWGRQVRCQSSKFWVAMTICYIVNWHSARVFCKNIYLCKWWIAATDCDFLVFKDKLFIKIHIFHINIWSILCWNRMGGATPT